MVIIKIKFVLFDFIFLGLFGFYVCNEECEDSDFDLLVEFGKKINFFEFIDLE